MVKMSHVNLCLGCIFRCLAGSDCLFISECSLTRTSRLRAVKFCLPVGWNVFV